MVKEREREREREKREHVRLNRTRLNEFMKDYARIETELTKC